MSETNEIMEEVNDLSKEIDKLEKIVDTWHLKYYLGRLKSRHDILIDNKDVEIQVLKNRIAELEPYEIKKIEKTYINLTYDKASKHIKAYSNSKKRDPIFDECGRKWFIPKLNDNSYIKIRFIGKNLDDQEREDENRTTYIMGISSSSAIIGNTIMGKGKFKDIKNGFVLDKRTLSLLLIDPSVWFYALHGTEDVELIDSSEDIAAILEKY
jgi:hypothetical protein